MVAGALLHRIETAVAAHAKAAHALSPRGRDGPFDSAALETRNRPDDSHPANPGHYLPRLRRGPRLLFWRALAPHSGHYAQGASAGNDARAGIGKGHPAERN